MIENIISYSLRNRFLILLLAAGLFAWGAYSVKVSKIDAIPDLSENQVIVYTEWMGRSPQIIEDYIDEAHPKHGSTTHIFHLWKSLQICN